MSRVTLYIMVGVSGSGKSTYAKKIATETGAKIVSTDDIRQELTGDATRQDQNGWVFHLAFGRVENLLNDGTSVIVDATNINVKNRAEFVKIGKRFDAAIVAVVMDIDKETSKERNSKRSRVVPDHVIDKQSRGLVIPTKSEGFDTILTVR